MLTLWTKSGPSWIAFAISLQRAQVLQDMGLLIEIFIIINCHSAKNTDEVMKQAVRLLIKSVILTTECSVNYNKPWRWVAGPPDRNRATSEKVSSGIIRVIHLQNEFLCS